MRIIPILLLSLFLCPPAYAGKVFNSETGMGDFCVTVQEEDGSPSKVCPDKVKFANGNLTDNGDGSVSVADQTGAGGGDPVLVNTTAVADASGVDLTSGTTVSVTLNAAVSPDTATLNIIDDSILAAKFGDADWGDISVSSNVVSVENDSHDHSAAGSTVTINAADITDKNVNTDITADLEEEVTEGSLADSTIVSGDIKDGTIAGADLNASLVLPENTSVGLDPAGSADGKYTGITVTGTGGATIAFGDLVTLDKDDSRWELVDISVAAAATGDARGIIGIAVTTSSDGGALTVLLKGIIRADANFPALTIGAPVYASTTGDIVVAQPTTTDHVIRIVGFALTADEISFDPDNTYTTHT